MIFILLSISVLYLLLHLIFFIGYLKSKNCTKLPDNQIIRVSVIVAARNEEDNISNCISALKKLEYPPGLLEIILVNDESADNTKDLMMKETINDNKFIVIDSRKSSTSNLKGKPNAIDTAIEKSKGDIIFITDADCEVPINWVNNMVSYYFDNSVGMVCGFANIKNNHKLFSAMQSLDWIYLLSLATSSAGINKPLSCIGNNISFRKNVYYEVGGYSAISFSITEDLALMRTIANSRKYKVKFPIDSECIVNTLPCLNISELYYQKKRWFKGGIGINMLGYLLGFELYIMNLILIFGLIFLNPYIFLILILLKIFSELLIMIPVYKKLRFRKLIIYFPVYQIYFGLYGLILPFTFMLGTKINWKEREY